MSQEEWEYRTKLSPLIDEIDELLGKGEWRWARNTQCKYISIRIDMRDGAFILQDRNGDRISLEDLRYQYSSYREKLNSQNSSQYS